MTALRIWRWWVAACAICLTGLVVASEPNSDDAEYNYRQLLLHQGPEEIKLAAQAITMDRLEAGITVDLAALMFWRSQNHMLILSDDTLIWLLKALAETRSERYLPMLKSYRLAFANGPVKQALEQAIGKMNKPGEVFDPKAMVLAPIQQQLDDQFQRSLARRSGTRFVGLAVGTDIETLYQALGLPDASEIIDKPQKKSWFLMESTDYLLKLTYRGMGTVTLNRKPISPWFVEAIDVGTSE